jgi:hypothetical protein
LIKIMGEGVAVSTDQVSLGVLVAAVGRDGIDSAVEACGVKDQRSGGKLPAHVVAYLAMALSLFPEDDYEEVAAKVTGALDCSTAGTRLGACRPPVGSLRPVNGWAAG